MKKYGYYFLLPVLMLLSCSNWQADTKPGIAVHTDSTVAPAAMPKDSVSEHDAVLNAKSGKKLRYMYAANGGLIGFSTMAPYPGAPRCDMIIKRMYRRFMKLRRMPATKPIKATWSSMVTAWTFMKTEPLNGNGCCSTING